MANGHGGERANAGRKSLVERFGSQIVAAQTAIAAQLPDTIARIVALAAGAAPPKVEEKFKVAGTLIRKDVVRDAAGQPLMDGKGRFTPIEVPMFPDADPDEEVLVERKVTTGGYDLQANAYLGDRILGKAIPADDPPIDPNEGKGLPYDLTLLDDADYEKLGQILSRAVPRGPSDAPDPGPAGGGAGGGAAPGA